MIPFRSQVTLALALLGPWLALLPRADAAVVYSALVDGLWRVHYQAAPDAVPIVIPAGDATIDARAPRLSADGRQVALELTGNGIMVCAVAPPHDCAPPGGVGPAAVRPVWDADGEELVFVRYVLEPDSEDADILRTTGGRSGSGALLWMTGIQDYPDVSADGLALVFSSGSTISLHRAGVQVVQSLWVTDLVSGLSRQVSSAGARDVHPRWSPDGARLAFASDRGGRSEIWLSAADGSGARQLTSGNDEKSWPAWSPDGREILFVRAHRGAGTLWIVDVASGAMRRLQPPGLDPGVELRDPDWR